MRVGKRADRALAVLESDRGGWAAIGAAMVVSIAVSLWLSRGTTFWFDEFTLFSGSRGFNIAGLFTQHNEQLIFLPRLIYATVFKLFGANYAVIRVIEAVGVALVGATVYALCRPRIGALALAPAILLMFFGSSWDSTLTGNGIINVYCLLPGLAAMLVLDRGIRFGDPLACLLLALSLSSWTAGLAFVAGAGVLIFQQGGLRQRWWVFLVPLVLWGAWYAFKPGLEGPLYTGTSSFKLSNVLLIPNFAAASLAAVMAGVSGLNYDFSQQDPALSGVSIDNSWGPALAVVAAGALLLILRRRRPSRWPWPWIATLATFWVATAMVSFALRPPSAGRYVYVASAVAMVLAAWALAGFRLTRRLAIVVAACLAFALGANLAHLRDAGTYLRGYANAERADLSAIEIARGHENPDYVPSEGLLHSVFIGPSAEPSIYLPAVDRNGSFADTLPELRSAPEANRDEADQVLAGALLLHLAPTSPPRDNASCTSEDGTGFRLEPGTTLLRFAGPKKTDVTLRRFGSSYAASIGTASPGRYYALHVPTDAAPDPWFLHAEPPRRVTACPS